MVAVHIFQIASNFVCGSDLCGSASCLRAVEGVANDCGYTEEGEDRW